MLRGWFDPRNGRPYLVADVELPRLGISGEIAFLVDTGADSSLLSPSDSIRLNIDFARLIGDVRATGVGGAASSFLEPAIILFTEPRIGRHSYHIDLAISPLDATTPSIPSLLGRDILDRWVMTYAPSRAELSFEVVSADRTLA